MRRLVPSYDTVCITHMHASTCMTLCTHISWVHASIKQENTHKHISCKYGNTRLSTLTHTCTHTHTHTHSLTHTGEASMRAAAVQGEVRCLAFSPCGHYLALGYTYGTLQVLAWPSLTQQFELRCVFICV